MSVGEFFTGPVHIELSVVVGSFLEELGDRSNRLQFVQNNYCYNVLGDDG